MDQRLGHVNAYSDVCGQFDAMLQKCDAIQRNERGRALFIRRNCRASGGAIINA